MKYDGGVERGAFLRIEGVCLPKVGRRPHTKTAVTNAGGKKKRLSEQNLWVDKLLKMPTNAPYLLEDKIIFLQTTFPRHVLFLKRPRNNGKPQALKDVF